MPITRANRSAMDDLLPAAYAEYAGRYLSSMRAYPLPFTTPENVAEAVYAAATDREDRLRYPAGGDSVALAELRQSLPEQEFMARIRALAGDGAAV